MHTLNTADEELTIRTFAGMLSEQLSQYGRFLQLMENGRRRKEQQRQEEERRERQLELEREQHEQQQREDELRFQERQTRNRESSIYEDDMDNRDGGNDDVGDGSGRKRARLTDLTVNAEDEELAGRIVYRYHDANGGNHWVVRYTKTIGSAGKKYTKARRCKRCGGHTCCFCYQCNIPLCYCISAERTNGITHERKCFKDHIKEHVRKSNRIGNNDTVSELVID